MGAYADWLDYTEHPTEELARLPPPPAELLPEHRAAFLDGYRRERMAQAAGLSPSWYGPPIEEPRA